MKHILKKLSLYLILFSAFMSFQTTASAINFPQKAKLSNNMSQFNSEEQTNNNHTNNRIKNPIISIANKSLTDKNDYYFTTLTNNLKTILVSDPQAERFSASLSVNVGSFQDPKQQQGLAHFLEHMLFLGTEKYPQSGDYQSYINTHSGSHNAYTSTDTTNFYFDIKPSNYEGALDRFSQFFIAPLFSESLTQREKNAVDAEYKAKLKNESRRNNQALKTLMNDDHPYNRFTVGNLETLKDLPDNPLREQLLTLYQQHYFAENMVLVMIANLPYEDMAKLAQQYFSDIKKQNLQNKEALTEPSKKPTLISANKPHLQFIHPLIDNDTLSFYYQIDAQQQNYKTQPTRYLSYILGNENEGSLYASLKAEGLINSISVSTSSDYDNNAFFTVKINLTNEGMTKIDTVAQRFFATIKILKSSPVNSIYLKEGLKLSQMMFNYQSYVDPQNLARSLSARALKIPTEDLISSFRIEETAKPEEVNHLLQQLDANNLLIQITSNNNLPVHWAATIPKWKTELWYQSEYSNNDFSQVLLNFIDIASTNTPISLPEKNNYIPESLEIISEHNETPILTTHEQGFSYWHKSDPSFNKPTSINFLAFRFERAAETPKNTLLNRLWSRLFNESVSEDTYAPYMAGLGFSFYPHVNGVTLRTNGYSDKQNDYLVWLVDQLFLFRPNLERFELAKTQLQKDLSNQKSKQAYQGANSALNTLITKNSFTTKELEESLAKLTLKDLQDFTQKARQEFDIVGYSTGNITQAQTEELASQLYQRFGRRVAAKIPITIETKDLISQQKQHYRFDSTSDDSVVLYSLIDTSTQTLEEDEAIIEKIYFSIIRKLINSPFYQDLRTNKQLGYIVGTQNLSRRNTPILGLVIQSPNKDTFSLIEAIEGFLLDQETKLNSLTDEDFDAAKNSLLHQLQIKAKNLSDNALNEWSQIAKIKPDFQHREKWIKSIEGIQKEDFIVFIKDKLQSIESTRIVIHNKPFPPELIKQSNWVEKSATNKGI